MLTMTSLCFRAFEGQIEGGWCLELLSAQSFFLQSKNNHKAFENKAPGLPHCTLPFDLRASAP